MSKDEEIIRLQMRVAELEKEKKKDKREKSTLLEKIVTLEEDIEVLSRAVRSSEQKLRLELFVRFGSSSERYRKYFNISEELIRKAEEEQLSDEEQKIIDNAKELVESDKKLEASNKKGSRNRNPEHRTRGNGCGRQTFDPSYPEKNRNSSLRTSVTNAVQPL